MIDEHDVKEYIPTPGSSEKGKCFIVQCMNHYELTKMALDLDQEYHEPNNYPAVIGAIESLDGTKCKPVCMSQDSYEFMPKSDWIEPLIISFRYYKKIFEGIDLDQMELYESLGMKS